MRRIFSDHAYGPAPVQGSYWAETVPDETLMRPPATGDLRSDVAVIGAGFTGLSAALHLAKAGADVIVLDAQHPGWGASGRNGGFCCLGGAKADDALLRRRFGEPARADWRRTEADAIKLVDDLLQTHGINADTHSNGETLLAHSPAALREIETGSANVNRDYGVTPTLHDAKDLEGLGLSGPFHGGITVPLGFGLNPRKYLSGLLKAAEAAGARVFGTSPVTSVTEGSDTHGLGLPKGRVLAKRLVLATNGYSSENVPDWMAARYMPAQSSVLVTRPLSEDEKQAAGWTSAQMAFDSRYLLHYFRLMPDGRFLFGRRGGLTSSAGADRAAIRTTRAHFDAMFPAWAKVETPYNWSGMVCLSAGLVPFCGPIPNMPGAFAGFAYHGNGVAMGSYAGALLADLALGKAPQRRYPRVMQGPAKRFPLGRFRRALMPAIYAAAGVRDRLH
ncbi:FAD-binding oxidoreductase [Lutimaribacter sp. EGI FJ00015]|uniref:FAD-binding oxidoreductase n=1 Tax=Lutimaribacter degradans TaxID=2945989 RepID=A0ACC5ZXR9_9RHOB|nr:FAD-dependent oxidoreductase [Lutimaribacter sp. EGI FJ00013]MCM2562861.1 FAD-binding oxidoreductase [Lutimaribacter sp. EGI FJ00013]MCO0614018.1 FAD-binding oxidoreductase [Lutimaribacter sp. EGI FJ00015]MCO0636990.1 FAD-binding oxidoreductase [Lutimaribacter sp. EGI FJ00014]